MDKRKEIGARIYKLRKKLGLTQRDLGKLFGVEHNTVSTYESGDAYPTIDNLITLATQARVTIEWLIMGTDENTPIEKVLTVDELQLLLDYRSANEETRLKIAKIVKIILEDKNHSRN